MRIRPHNLGGYTIPDDAVGGVCVDIGANVGSFIRKNHEKFGKIHYFEPILECFNICQGFSANHPHIVGHNKAAWSESGLRLDILLHSNGDSGSCAIRSDLLNDEWDRNEVVQSVESISLDDICSVAGGHIDYCKCDCENSEYLIFLGKDLSRVNYIAMELHYQMGEEKHRELLNFLLRTHDLLSGRKDYVPKRNNEILLKRKENNMNVTVVLNSFKRPQFLKEQIRAVEGQTARPKEIMIWNNNPESTFNYKGLAVANSNKNFGVWSRFAYALNARTEYVCVFDDDTIPGARWLENCLETMKTNEGLLGTIGLIFNSKDSYYPHRKYGWDSANGNINNSETTRVDIVGHSWFFKREWLPYFWMESSTDDFDVVGEDMNFSYAIQKHLGLNTYVPPHPRNDRSLWGSLKGMQYGTAKGGISHGKLNQDRMVEHFKMLMKRGFKIINE